MRHHNQRYAFLTSQPLDIRAGYGTAAALLGLMQALHRKGKRVGVLEPSPLPGPATFRRWWFNWHLPGVLSRMEIDCVIGVDFDGYRYAKQRTRRPFVALLHGVKADELPWETGSNKARRTREVRREGESARHADLVLAPSAYACQRACEEYGVDPARTRVIPNGLELEAWPPLPAASGSPTVLAAGRLIERKGLDLLLDAWPLVRRAIPDARLLVAGDGPLRQRLEMQAVSLGVRDAVDFCGVLSQGEFRQRLASAHVFCMPSRQEAFGLAMLEAMASMRAVVATRCAALPEVAGDGAQWSEPSPEALALSIRRLFEEPALREALAERARRRAELYTWDRSAALFGEALTEA